MKINAEINKRLFTLLRMRFFASFRSALNDVIVFLMIALLAFLRSLIQLIFDKNALEGSVEKESFSGWL